MVSSAVDEQNPEVQEARRLQIPVIPRGELLAELMRLKYGIAVAGSHGKTTTTSMTATILNHAGLDPTVVVGGRVGTMGGSNARVGRSDFLVVESDESDGSFLKLAPIVAVVTNIDREHLDHYPSLDAIRAAFIEFVNKVPFYGAAIVCLDDANVQSILPAIKPPHHHLRHHRAGGRGSHRDLSAARLPAISACAIAPPIWAASTLRIPGRHNVLNAMAAVAVALELEVKPDVIREALATFSGVDRRFQMRGEERGITVIDDYGHHPTEIRATLDGARLCGFRRIHVLFQPHRYTRTFHLMDEFARSFHQADSVFVLDIYAASEKPIEGVTAEVAGGAHPPVRPSRRGIRRHASIAAWTRCWRAAAEGDLVLTLGAGNVWQAGEKAPGTAAGGRAELMAREAKKQPARFDWRSGASASLPSAPSASPPPWPRSKVQPLRRVAIRSSCSRTTARTRSPFEGLTYASRAKVQRVFAGDFDRSIFSVPLAERRRRLLAIDWVEDASVSRVWPDRLVVRIRERKPVAFVSFRVRTAADRRPGRAAGSAAAGAVHLPGAQRRPRGGVRAERRVARARPAQRGGRAGVPGQGCFGGRMPPIPRTFAWWRRWTAARWN